MVMFPFGRLVHGNTLTAAVVVENVKAAVAMDPTATFCTNSADTPAGSRASSSSNKPCVFLTGATSKVCCNHHTTGRY